MRRDNGPVGPMRSIVGKPAPPERLRQRQRLGGQESPPLLNDCGNGNDWAGKEARPS